MTFVKFCGMTREADVAAAIDLGVDAIGLILWPQSPRHVTHARAARLVAMLPDRVTPVGVLVKPSDDDVKRAVEQTGIRVVQIHGSPVSPATAAACEQWAARSLETDPDEVADGITIVLDAHDPARHGGTGRTIDWKSAAAIAARRRVILAGGLNALNVTAAIQCVHPYGVDVASGIEESPGVKNADAMRAFAAAVREAEQ